MDSTLVTVTLLSMGMAAALSVIVWRMLRDERQRSDARVAVLAGMAARPSAPSRSAIDLPMRSAAANAPVVSSSLFEEHHEPSPWGHRFAVMFGIALVLTSAVFFTLSASASKTTTAAAAAAASAGTPAAATGLELISLRDSRQSGSLTITGLVRNPVGSAPMQRVSVTAYTFDDKGSFLASGRALLDVTSLAAGDESPFVVSVPVTDTVARYRIGFRGEDGHVIAHVDKRQQGPIAELQSGSTPRNW